LVFGGSDRTDFYAQLQCQSLLGKKFVRFLGYLLIHRPQEGWQGFQYRDLRTQTSPYAPHFETDDAGADDAQFFRYRFECQSTRVGENQLFIESCIRQGARTGTCGKDHMLGSHAFLGSTADLDEISIVPTLLESAATVEKA